jgi:AcrR family transcriptional regulator
VRAGLSRERILEASLRLVDTAGLAGLSMRRLAAALGVDPMAVYHYFRGKRAILLALVETVFSGMPAPEPGVPWQRQLRQWARAYRDLARAHPGLLLSIVSDPEAVGVAAAHANERLARALETADPALPPDAVLGAIALVVDWVNGHVLPEAGGPLGGDDPVAAFLAGQPEDRFPALRRLLAPAPRPPDLFEFGLDVIVAGLEVAAPAAPG